MQDFQPGHVYVLEFWATWCGPCVGNMEHLSQVQEQYASDDVTVIGLSDEKLSTVVSFLFKPYGQRQIIQNDRIRYPLATDPDRSVYRAYMDAAGTRRDQQVLRYPVCTVSCTGQDRSRTCCPRLNGIPISGNG